MINYSRFRHKSNKVDPVFFRAFQFARRAEDRPPDGKQSLATVDVAEVLEAIRTACSAAAVGSATAGRLVILAL
jgi:hypothetical protein